MTNAKIELLEKLEEIKKEKKDLKCSFIENIKINRNRKEGEDLFGPSKEIILKVNFTDEDYNKFLNELDFIYDSGYGGQELFGTVWFNDGTWLERGEYDGSEWWEYKHFPKINEKCL